MHHAETVTEQFFPSVVDFQGITAIFHETQHGVEIRAGQTGIRRGFPHFLVPVIRVKRRGAGEAEQMLRQHIQSAGPGRIAVAFPGRDTLDRGLAFQHLEPVGGDQDRLARLVHAVVGAANPLQQARYALGRPHLKHLINRPPVDAQIERGGGDHGAQTPLGHGGLDLAALADLQAAMVQADGQHRIVQPPQRLEHQLRLGAGVDEHDGHARGADAVHDARGGGETHVPGPGQTARGEQDGEVRRGAVRGGDDAGGAGIGPDRLGVRDGGGQANAAGGRGERAQPFHAQRQLVAAFGARERMHLIHHDRLQRSEKRRRIGGGDQHRQTLRRGQQQMRRRLFLTRAAVGGGVAGAGLDTDGQPHLGEGGGQVAGDVGGQSLQRADIDGMQTLARCLRQVHQGGKKARERLAAAGGRDQQHAFPRARRVQHRDLMRSRLPAAGGEPGGEGFR